MWKVCKCERKKAYKILCLLLKVKPKSIHAFFSIRLWWFSLHVVDENTIEGSQKCFSCVFTASKNKIVNLSSLNTLNFRLLRLECFGNEGERYGDVGKFDKE